MNLDHDFVHQNRTLFFRQIQVDIYAQMHIRVKLKKKGLHQKWNTIFTPNSSGHLRSDAHQSQIIGGDADVDHTQAIGGHTIKLLGRIYRSQSPRVSAPLLRTQTLY